MHIRGKRMWTSILFFLISYFSPLGYAQTPHARYGHHAVLVGSQIYVTGGVQSSPDETPMNDFWSLDLNATNFSTQAQGWQDIKSAVDALNVPNTAFGAACPIDKTMYVFGGNTSLNGSQYVSHLLIIENKICGNFTY